MKRPRLLLADDHALMLHGIRNVLEKAYNVVAAVTDGPAVVAAALRLKPVLIIMDITMPLLNGIDAAREIRKHLPKIKLLFLTMHNRPTYLKAALDAGANGYLIKSSGREEILAAVGSVLAGNLYVSPAVESDDAVGETVSPADNARPLSPRERDHLRLIADGRSRKEIAHALSISERTVAFHKNNLKRKLGLWSTAELTRYAIEQELS